MKLYEAHTYLKFVNVFTVEIAKSKWKNKCYAYVRFMRSLLHKSGSGALPPNSYKWSKYMGTYIFKICKCFYS
jgi:hypothetical protein